MEVVISNVPKNPNEGLTPYEGPHKYAELVLAPLIKQDSINTQLSLGKALQISAKEIVAKLNEKLAASLPDGLQSLQPDDWTADATASRIVSGITSLFAAYQKQNPKLSGEEVLTKFMELARSGVDRGYSDAYAVLQDLNAFSIDGVKSGVEQTKLLIESKFVLWEQQKRQDSGLPVTTSTATPTTVRSENKSASTSLAVTA